MTLGQQILNKSQNEQINICLGYALSLSLSQIPDNELLIVQDVLWKSVSTNMNWLQHLNAINTEMNRRSSEKASQSNIDLVKNSINISENSLALERSNNALAEQSLKLTKATLAWTKWNVLWATIAAIASIASALYAAHVLT